MLFPKIFSWMKKRYKLARHRISGSYRCKFPIVAALTGQGQVLQCIAETKMTSGEDVLHSKVRRREIGGAAAVLTAASRPEENCRPALCLCHLRYRSRTQAKLLHQSSHRDTAPLGKFREIDQALTIALLDLIREGDQLLLLLGRERFGSSLLQKTSVGLPKRLRKPLADTHLKLSLGECCRAWVGTQSKIQGSPQEILRTHPTPSRFPTNLGLYFGIKSQ